MACVFGVAGSWPLQQVVIDLVFWDLTALVTSDPALFTRPLQEVPETEIGHFATSASGARGLRPAG